MITDPREFRVEVLLSFQRALWDMVTPSLRGVAVRPAFPDIQARFLYEHVSSEDREIVPRSLQEAIARDPYALRAIEKGRSALGLE